MIAKPDVADPYACETGPFLGQALWDDLQGAAPSADAVAWARRHDDMAMADPRPALTPDQLRANLWHRHQARLKRDQD